MATDAATLRRILLGKIGCEELPKKRHECYAIVIDGRIVAQTFMSRGARGAMSLTLLRLIAKQLNVTLRDFKQVIDCTMEGDLFRQLVRQNSS